MDNMTPAKAAYLKRDYEALMQSELGKLIVESFTQARERTRVTGEINPQNIYAANYDIGRADMLGEVMSTGLLVYEALTAIANAPIAENTGG
mgnify:FL=1